MWGNMDGFAKKAAPVGKVISGTFSRRKKSRMGRVEAKDFRLYLSAMNSGNAQAHKSLVELTGCDFGTDFDAWLDWYEDNKNLTREDWSLDCLERAGVEIRGLSWEEYVPTLIRTLGHAKPVVRTQAYRLLKHHAKSGIAFSPHASKETRRMQQEDWAAWWRMNGSRYLHKRRNSAPPAPQKAVAALAHSETGPDACVGRRRAKRSTRRSDGFQPRFDIRISRSKRQLILLLRIALFLLALTIAVLPWVFSKPGGSNTEQYGVLLAVAILLPGWMSLNRFERRDVYFNPWIYWGVFFGLFIFFGAILLSGR